MLVRMAPLQSGRDTEIDMIEREMEGGVLVIQPRELSGVEQHVETRELRAIASGDPKD